MKRLLFTILLTIIPSMSPFAQETLRGDSGEPTLVERFSNGKAPKSNVEVNFQLFTSANAEFTGNELDGMSFKLNRVKLEIKGDVGKNLGYHYRQSFNKYSAPYSLDNLSSSLELAYVILKPNNRLSFSIGKQFVNHGGYEYYVNPIRVREFSEFNNLLACYQAGVGMNWMVTPDHELCFQVLNNRESLDDDIYATGLPEGVSKAKVPFMYTANWNSYFIDRSLQFRYAMALGQSVDSLKIAKEIAKHSLKKDIVTDVLLEINIGAEESKTGFSVSEFQENLYEISLLKGISVKGLMTIPPICENNTELCKYFENIYNIYVDIKAKKIDNICMDILSMGMSGDYETAIQFGSNLVRIGSAIFGPRIY